MNNDLISREALKEAIRKRLGISSLNYLTEQEKVIVEEIDNALTVDMNTELSVAYLKGRRQGQSEERPQGEWINDSDDLPICNECGEVALQRVCVKDSQLIQTVRMVRSNYCPNCGACMVKENEE